MLERSVSSIPQEGTKLIRIAASVPGVLLTFLKTRVTLHNCATVTDKSRHQVLDSGADQIINLSSARNSSSMLTLQRLLLAALCPTPKAQITLTNPPSKGHMHQLNCKHSQSANLHSLLPTPKLTGNLRRILDSRILQRRTPVNPRLVCHGTLHVSTVIFVWVVLFWEFQSVTETCPCPCLVHVPSFTIILLPHPQFALSLRQRLPVSQYYNVFLV